MKGNAISNADGSQARERRLMGGRAGRTATIVLPWILLLSVAGGACTSDGIREDGESGALGETSGAFHLLDGPVVIAATLPDEAAQLFNPNDATRLPDGSIVVADMGGNAVVRFDSTGHRIGSMGRRGSGPGEFRFLVRVRRCPGDSLLTFDAGEDRVTVLDHSLAPVREFRVPSASVVECSAAGVLVTRIGPAAVPPRPSAESPLLTARLRILDAGGDSIGGVDTLIVGHNRVMAPLATMALGTDRLYAGTGAEPRVDVYDLTGRPLPPIQLDLPVRPSTAEHYDAAIERLVGRVRSTASIREAQKKVFAAVPRPEFLPVYTKILTDRAGNLWLVTSSPGDGHTSLAAFRPDGSAIGTITLPAEMEIWEVGSDHLLGSVMSEEGEPSVVMYRFRTDAR